jgi:PilZ domain
MLSLANAHTSDRRRARRHRVKAPLRVRVWRSPMPEQRGESINLSRHGVYFATDTPLSEGEAVELLLTMPEEVSGEPATEWRYTGHVLRVDRVDCPGGIFGVGVQFDCYEVSRLEQTQSLCDAGLRWTFGSRVGR